MRYQRVIYTILVIVVAAVIGIFSYTNQYIKMSQQDVAPVNSVIDREGTSFKKNENGRNDRENKISMPFTLVDSSDDYKSIVEMYKKLSTESAASSTVNEEEVLKIYKEIISFYEVEKNSPRQRGYALNLLNLVFLIDFDAAMLEKGLSVNNQLHADFQKNLKYAKSLRFQNKLGDKGTMSGQGSAEMNYAAHKTLASINKISYSLYPGSYALLRSNLNNLTADFIINENHLIQKKYQNSGEMMLGNYGKNYLNELDEDIKKLISEKRLYEDAYSSSYEIDLMYGAGVIWPKYQLVKMDTKKRAEAEALLKDYVLYANHSILASDQYKAGRSLFGYIIPAFSKSRAAKEGILSSDESLLLASESEAILLKLIRGPNTSNLKSWLRDLPKGGWMQKELIRISSKNDELRIFVDSL